jgi:hypothetical protein
MGLLSALAGLPLAPLNGLMAIARQIQQQASEEQARELVDLQAELLELQLSGDVGIEASESKEAELLEKIWALVGATAGENE